MRPIIEKYLPDFEAIKAIKQKLKTCKDEWLEKDVKGKSVLGHNTMRQIIEHAVEGFTYWDFTVESHWKEEVYAYNKQSQSWNFDGYVFHVKGSLTIPGVGTREQYGCKVAVGGKDNQNSAYKAAASDAFKKCASLFGVGEEIYSKIKVDMDEEQQYQQMQQDPNVQFQQPQQNWQQPQQQWNPNQQQMPQQWQQNAQPQQQQWSQPQQPQQNWGGQQAQGNFNGAPGSQISEDELPFNPHQPGTPQAQAWDQRNTPPAKENTFSAQSQGQVQPQAYEPQAQQGVQFGAPAQPPAPQAPEPSAVPVQWDQQEMQAIHLNKARLNIQTDEQFNPYIRDFLKKEDATIRDLTPANLGEFNQFLAKFTA
jgi:hypothetical protein